MTQHIDVFEIDFLEQSSKFFLRQILSNYLQFPAEDLEIVCNEFGKPYLRAFPECYFNLSHSGEKMVLAISQSPIGIDIEQIKSRHSFAGIVKKCFTNSEQNYWFDLPENEKLTIFYDFWTRKEAVVKGIGRGIALGLNRCEINVNQPNQFLNLPNNQSWFTQRIETSTDYCAAIATTCSDVKVNHIFYHY